MAILMTNARSPDRWPEDEDQDASYDDVDDDDSPEWIACPECGADVYEEAEQCPECGNYIIHTTSVWAGRPPWWVILGILGIVLTVLALAVYG